MPIQPATLQLVTPTFRQRLALVGEPIAVVRDPRLDADENECVNAVAAQIAELGGDMVIGWALSEWSSILCEAIWHAVWRNNSGILIDVSFKDDDEHSILFWPDPNLTDDGIQRDNVRVPLSDNPLILEFISVSEAFHRLLSETHSDITGPSVTIEGPLLELHDRRAALATELRTCPNTGL